MWYSIFLSLCFLFVLARWRRKNKRIDAYTILLLLYLFVAILCVYECYICKGTIQLKVWDISTWNIKLWPMIYLFVVIILFFRPFKKYDSRHLIENLVIPQRLEMYLSVISVLYIIFSLISIYYSITSFQVTISIGDYQDAYNESVDRAQYVNALDGIAKRYTDYLRPLVVFLSFYLMLIKKKKIFLSIIALFFAFLCALMISALNASRGGAFSAIMLLVFCLVIFWYKMPRKVKTISLVLGGSVAVFFVIYSILVTNARFEDDSISSILFYFGHSFLAFNYGIAPCLTQYSQGTYLFNWFLPFFGITPIPCLGNKVEGLFISFVGSLYKDFGFIGTLFIAVFFPLLINRMMKPRNMHFDIASAYIYVFFYMQMVSGVFVYGNAQGFLWFVAILIFLFLKFLVVITNSKRDH